MKSSLLENILKQTCNDILFFDMKNVGKSWQRKSKPRHRLYFQAVKKTKKINEKGPKEKMDYLIVGSI